MKHLNHHHDFQTLEDIEKEIQSELKRIINYPYWN